MKRAVVIEDSRTQALALARVLAGGGFEPHVAHDGAAGLALCRAAPPAVVVSDIVMPGLDGFEVCRRLKADPATTAVPVVLLTSLAEPLDVVRALAAGADNFIPKPYDDASLLARVQRLAASGVRRADDTVVEVAGQTVEVRAGRAQILDALVASLEAGAARHAELERQHAETQRAVRDRDELIAIVSHDLRNPLAAVLTATSLAERAPPDPAGLQQKLGVIRRSAERMNRLIGDLLDVSRLEAGRLALERASHDVAGLVDEAVSAQRALADAKAVRLEVALAADLPPVDADRDRLLQVFANLLGNAVKFTPAGGVVTVRAGAVAGAVRFAVVDTGPGLAPQDHPRVFDRFWQAGRANREGTGLGLPIVKGIVEAHGGQVWVESALGAGATFYFTVPTAAA